MKFVALALMLSAANAACPNKCSGHGDCTVNDVCVCYQDWQSGDEAGGDCSDRTCPFDIAWADVPSAEDTAHGYAECSAKGVCNRKTGLCECFDGYTGKACRRTTCPNDCSGHGTCEYVQDVHPSGFNGDETNSDYGFNSALSHNLLGDLWDAKKTRMCVCDPKWTDVDCSRRMCPKGNDVLDRNNEANCDDFSTDLDQVQHVCFNLDSADDATKTIALVYSDLYGNKYSTSALAMNAHHSEVQSALRSLPDHALGSVTVSSTSLTATNCPFINPSGRTAEDTTFGWAVTFTGLSGNQPLLDVLADACGAGCQPRRDGIAAANLNGAYSVSQTEAADGNAYECGRRGKCDYSTGICECFTGFTDEDCSTQSALA
jgi:hypothetical protein